MTPLSRSLALARALQEPTDMQRRPLTSLGRRLLAAFLAVGLLPLAVALLLSAWSTRGVVSDLLAANVGTTARLYAAEVDDFLAQKVAMLDALAAGVLTNDDVLTGVVHGSAVFDELLLLDRAGHVAARSTDGEAWVLDACRSALTEGSMTHAQHGHGHQVVVAVARDGGGSLCGRTSFTLHEDMLRERAESAFGGLAYIVDRAGTVVCHAFPEHEPHAHPGEPVGAPADAAARTGEAWSGIVVVGGVPHLAAYAPASSLPWGVWASVPVAQAGAVLRPHTTRALGLGTILALAMAALAGVLSHRIAAPVEELEEARRFSDTLLDTLDQRILVVGPDLQVLRANRAAQAEWGDSIVGARCRDVHGTPPDEPCPVESVFASGIASCDQRVRRSHDGRTQILAIDRYPVPGPSGPRAVLEITRDITEQEQVRAHLQHQQKMAALGTLAAGLAHEIGNPLASLSSELEILRIQPDDLDSSLPVLVDQVRRIGELLRELVELGRKPSDRITAVDLDTVVADVIRLLRHNARAVGVTLVQESTPALVAHTNRDRLIQVLLNLGLNAVVAAGQGGTVWVRTARVAEGARIRVRDDGPGVPEAIRERLFEPFFTTKAPGAGTGLGLFVVDRVVSALGGTVHLVDGPGPGACFDLILPDLSDG